MTDNMKFAYTASYTTESNAYNRYASGNGIHVYRINSDKWEEIQEVQENNPSFIGFNKDKCVLYAAQSATENCQLEGIVSYSVNHVTGMLKKTPKQLKLGKAICCFSVHPSGKYMIVADFKGIIYVISLCDDSTLNCITDTVALEGQLGPLKNVQKCSRPHQIPFDLDGRYIVIPDKGFDLVHVYQLNTETGKLARIEQTEIRPTSCARHIAFHPDRKRLYMTTEYTSKVYVFDYDAIHGHIIPRQIISSERDSYVGNYCKNSEIVVHPNGKFVYVSNRGDNTITILSINETSGLLKPVNWVETHGEIPRFFCLNEKGTKMYVGNQKTGTIETFSVDKNGAELIWEQKTIQVPCPTWILFL